MLNAALKKNAREVLAARRYQAVQPERPWYSALDNLGLKEHLSSDDICSVLAET